MAVRWRPGRVQQIWAVMGLLIITGLYALSARLFRQTRFMWLVALLVIAPWTILTILGWFTPYRPTVPGLALSWARLVPFLDRFGAAPLYPNRVRFALKVGSARPSAFFAIGGAANGDTSRFTFALAIGWYNLAAISDYHWLLKHMGESFSALEKNKFLYPAFMLLPVWSVYLLAWLLPAARHEHYGLILLAFGLLGLIAGQWLKWTAPRQKVT